MQAILPSAVAASRTMTTGVVDNVDSVYAEKGNVSVCCLGDTRTSEKRKVYIPISLAVIDGYLSRLIQMFRNFTGLP